MEGGARTRAVLIPVGPAVLAGDVTLPLEMRNLVLFAHGSGSSRSSPRNRYVASVLQQAHLGTLLFDLLTPDEEIIDEQTASLRFNIPLLAERLSGAASWVRGQAAYEGFRLSYFGASTGAAAALLSAADPRLDIAAIVSRGGRADLAGSALEQVRAPTLLIVGGLDRQVLELNEQALALLRCHRKLEIVPAASHLFPERGALEQVAQLARDWLVRHGG